MKENGKKIGWFLLYAFTIPLACALLMRYIEGCKEGAMNLIIYGIEGASPAIAAILVQLQGGGVKQLGSFLDNAYRKNFNIQFVLVAFLGQIVLLSVAWIICRICIGNEMTIALPTPKKLLVISWALVAEELGWRGYLQGIAEKMIPSFFVPIVVGLIWSLWHYHFWISGTMDAPVLFFIYGAVAESFAYYALTKASKNNVIPASIWHFTGNLFFNIYLFNPDKHGGNIVPYAIASLTYTTCLFLYFRYKRKKMI